MESYHNQGRKAKLDHLLHHHRHKPQPGLAALQSFRGEVSDGLRVLIADSKQLSLTWVEHGLKYLHGLNKSFVKMVDEIDCPMSNWESILIDEYLAYTLEVLDLLNFMSKSLAHLQSIRLSLEHALASPSSATTRLLQSADHDQHPRKLEIKKGGVVDGIQGMVLEGVVEMRGVGLWVCGAIVCVLGGGTETGLEVPLLVGDCSWICGEAVEVKQVKEMASRVLGDSIGNVSGEELEEMKRKVESFRMKLEGVVVDVNCLFTEVLASRNGLMDCFRLHQE